MHYGQIKETDIPIAMEVLREKYFLTNVSQIKFWY